MIYEFICDELYVPMKAKEMAVVLNVPKKERGDLIEVLDALLAEGRIEVSGKGKYTKSESKYLTGTFTANARGFGFVTVEGEDDDIFISEDNTGGALHTDTVQVALLREAGKGKRREGRIVKIIARGMSRIVCTYEKSKTFGFAVPDNPKFGKDIFYPSGAQQGRGERSQGCGGDYGLRRQRQESRKARLWRYWVISTTLERTFYRSCAPMTCRWNFLKKSCIRWKTWRRRFPLLIWRGAWICGNGRP